MRKMSSDELKKVGKEVLRHIDYVCRKNGIRYFLAFGSLIGAVRHGGYIPWDDDIDVCMLRDDYEKFIKIMQYDQEYKLICIETDPDYYFPFARVCDRHTQLNLRGMREIHDFGVFADVFPIDSAPPEDDRVAWLDEYKRIWKKVYYTIPGSAHYREHSLSTIRIIIRQFPRRLLWGGSFNFDKYRKQMQEHIKKYNFMDTGYGTVLDPANNYGLEHALFPNDLFESVIKIKFEGLEVMTVENYDSFLRITYGDYMKFPPIEKRISHHHFVAYWK